MTIALLFALACTDGPGRYADSGSPFRPNTAAEAHPDARWPARPQLEDRISSSLSDAGVPGAQVSIVKDGAVVWASNFGLREVGTGKAVSTDTSFALASVSKTVTAVALLQVYETGAFDLDDPIAPYLAFTVDHPSSATPITFRHLLTHTSGIRDNWNVLEANYGPGDPSEPLGVFLERVLDPAGRSYSAKWNFTDWGPGEGNQYSNVGVALAGHLVEAITGVEFARWCDDRIFDPLAMDHTSWTLAGLGADPVASPHLCGGGCRPVAHYGYPDYPNGLLRSSASDMGRFLAAVTRGGELDGVRLLRSSTVTEMLRPQAKGGQGLAWYEESLGKQLLVGHNGGDTGVSTEMFFRRSDGTGFVLLMNAEPSAWRHVEEIERALLDAADGL
ncbi:MAG: CubicO group peptidase (beta-lactamase class C family) [Myxococcota bacterium]|jgi:CubicO group peptidase (beta-lactamase class C family)